MLATRAMQAWPGRTRGIYRQDRTPYGRYAYDPYGQTRFQAGLPLNVGFTGHIWDACIQQYFAPFRYYNPAAARWTMRDPLRYIDGPNIFSYAKGKPLTYIDSLGLFCFADLVPIGGIALLVGGLVLTGIGVPAISSGAILFGGFSGGQAATAGAILGGIGTVVDIYIFGDKVKGYVTRPLNWMKDYIGNADKVQDSNDKDPIIPPDSIPKPKDNKDRWFT